MFVKRVGTELTDGQGKPRVWRGIGIGNWLLPEGYMWGFQQQAVSPRSIESFVRRVAGAEWADGFWDRFRARFFSAADVTRIAAAGFDHVRLPFNARQVFADGQLSPAGIKYLDECISWCRPAGLLVLLDLHAAPGGQTGANIDDSVDNLPRLFTDPGHRETLITLWTQLARRYAAEPTIMGYDLLNEPLRDEFASWHGPALRSLYLDLTQAIRQVDQHHLIMYEGAHWATDFTVFTEVWDENSAVQFHRYWADPSPAGIASYQEIGDRLKLPLYLGETGENTDAWVAEMLHTAEEAAISWNFWPWKKVATTTSPVSIRPPKNWEIMVAAAEGRGPDPEPALARAALDELAANSAIAACDWNPSLLRALPITAASQLD